MDTRSRLTMALAKLKRDTAGQSAAVKRRQITVCAIARAANVTPGLVHKHYPDIAASVSAANGRPRLCKRVGDEEALKKVATISALRRDVEELRRLNQGMASENGRLELMIAGLRSELKVQQAGIPSISRFKMEFPGSNSPPDEMPR